MKCEPRGKYAGLKLHLDEKESQEILDWYKLYKSGNAQDSPIPAAFCKNVAKAMKEILVEHPDMLKERTPEQIKEALLRDQKKIVEQLAVIKQKGDWKKVK